MLFLFDIHSTIFDEAKEYVPALHAGIEKFIAEARKELPDKKLFYDSVYADLKKAHIELQSDWDPRAFNAEYMTSLRALFDSDESYNVAKNLALQTRRAMSLRLIKNAAYEGIVDFFKKLKNDGHHIYLCTDGNLTAAEDVIEALALNEIIDGSYCCASQCENPLASENNKIKFFNLGAFKPHARLIGEIILDYAKNNHLLPSDCRYEDAFFTNENPVEKEKLKQNSHFKLTHNKWMDQKLIPKIEILETLLNSTVIVGDSWRDILLGKNADILTIEATYGAHPKIKSKDYDLIKQESLAVIEKITHWQQSYGPKNKRIDRLNLFSNPKEKETVLNKTKADIKCINSIADISHFSRKKLAVEDDNSWRRLHQEKFSASLEEIASFRR